MNKQGILSSSKVDGGYTVSIAQKLSQAISMDMIELLKKRYNVGDEIHFTEEKEYANSRSQNKIVGRIKAKYHYIFMLEDGRTFRWIEVLVGNQKLKAELKHDLDQVSEQKWYEDHSKNYYGGGRVSVINHVLNKPNNRNRKWGFCRTEYQREAAELLSKFTPDEIDKLRRVIRA